MKFLDIAGAVITGLILAGFALQYFDVLLKG
jgi:hypothetical protein